MDPTSFTKTSFCGHEVDNITKNEDKEYILQLLKIQSNGILYTSRYAKVYNEQYAENLSNPHVLCIKSSGAPYLLFLTQLNDINYCFLIDKNKKKEYDYPKIFVIPYQFNSELYNGTLFETELIRDKHTKWSLLLGDIYMFSGNLFKKMIIIDRIKKIHDIFQNHFVKNEFMNICPIYIKKYFDIKDIDYVINDFACKLPYHIRGIYFIPIRTTYSNILYLFPRNFEQTKHHQTKHQLKNQQTYPQSNKQKNRVKSCVLRIIKTLKPDVYELYAMGENNIVKQGYAYIKDIKKSMYLFTITKDSNDIHVECSYNETFKKWEPLLITEKPISLSKDISF